jgi:hypothetical protein
MNVITTTIRSSNPLGFTAGGEARFSPLRPFDVHERTTMSRASVSGAGPLQKGAPPGANAKVEVEAKPSSVQEWLDGRRNKAPAPAASRAQPPGKSAAMQGGLTVNGAARRPSQPADSLDNFITSGKVASRGPSIFGGGGALAPRVPSQRFQKLALADVWPDDAPGSGSQFGMGEMDGELPSQPFGAQRASRGHLHGAGVSSAGSRAGAGARPAAAGPLDMSGGAEWGSFGANQPAAPSHGRRAMGSIQAQYGMAGGVMAAGGGGGRRCGGGVASTRPW